MPLSCLWLTTACTYSGMLSTIGSSRSLVTVCIIHPSVYTHLSQLTLTVYHRDDTYNQILTFTPTADLKPPNLHVFGFVCESKHVSMWRKPIQV